MPRPLKLTSETHRKEVRCGTLTIIIAFHEKTNTPVECYVRPAKKGTCKSNLGALGDLTDALLHKEQGIEDAIKALSGHVCNGCKSQVMKANGAIDQIQKELIFATSDKAKKELNIQLEEAQKLADIEMSCPGAVANVLQEWLEEHKKNEKEKKEEEKK